MIRCLQCPYWSAVQPEERMGVCTGMVGVIEVNAGSDGLQVQEFLTPAWFACNIPEQSQKPSE